VLRIIDVAVKAPVELQVTRSISEAMIASNNHAALFAHNYGLAILSDSRAVHNLTNAHQEDSADGRAQRCESLAQVKRSDIG